MSIRTFSITFLNEIAAAADHAAQSNMCSDAERESYDEMSRADQLEYGLQASSFKADAFAVCYPDEFPIWSKLHIRNQIEFLIVNENFK